MLQASASQQSLITCARYESALIELHTLKPPPVPSRFVSTVPGLGVLHWLQVFRRAQLRLAQPGHVQSSGENKPAYRADLVSV